MCCKRKLKKMDVQDDGKNHSQALIILSMTLTANECSLKLTSETITISTVNTGDEQVKERSPTGRYSRQTKATWQKSTIFNRLLLFVCSLENMERRQIFRKGPIHVIDNGVEYI